MNVDPFADAAPIVQSPGSRSVFFAASDFEGCHPPPRVWLVDGLVPQNTVTLLGGDGGTGKSLLALQLAVSVVLGRSWLRQSVQAGCAMFLSAEDDRDELHRRLDDIARNENVRLADLQRLTLRSLAGENALLATVEARTGVLRPSDLLGDLDSRLQADKPALVVLDTLADLFPGNENDRAQASQFVGILRRLAVSHSCAVVVLAHPSMSGLTSGAGTSGSTGWNNSVRSRLYLERVKEDGYEADPDARVLRTMKANYGCTGGQITLKWQEGIFVADAPVTGIDRVAASAKAERVFVKLLREVIDQGRRVNAAGGSTYAPSTFAKHPDAEGCTKSALRHAMEKLLSSRKIRIVEDGPIYKRRTFLAFSEDGV